MHPFRAAVEAGDVTPIRDLLDPDVKLYSPIPYRPFVGRDIVWAVLQGLWSVTEQIHYTDEFTSDDAVALVSADGPQDEELADRMRSLGLTLYAGFGDDLRQAERSIARARRRIEQG